MQCPNCYGTGHALAYEPWEDCPDCDGSGTVDADDDSRDGDLLDDRKSSGVMTIVERERQTGLPQVVDPRVERGAALLDERMPGWADMVNVTTLAINRPDRCILGQIGLCVFDTNYTRTAKRLLPSGEAYGDEAADHGFLVDESLTGAANKADEALLEYEWRVAILARRQA